MYTKFQLFQIDFLRLGRANRIHSNILKNSEEIKVKNVKSVTELNQLYNETVSRNQLIIF